MTKALLVELGLEEMPAYVVTPSEHQLGERMAAFLTEERLRFDKIETFSTPRRLAVRVTGLAEAQSDIAEDFKGPAKKIALDAEGNFTKAAQGFVRGKGLTTDDIRFEMVNGEEYVYVTKQEKGRPVQEVLVNLPKVLSAMDFPVSMHWGSHQFEYIRPVHTLLALLDEEVIPMTFLNISSGRVSRGHRFLGKETEIANPMAYETSLRSQHIIASAKDRQDMIIKQIKALEGLHEFVVDIDEGLLNEVLNLVEYPTVFVGRFDPKYLEVPEEVLVTSMKNHQRYFVTRDQSGQLLPFFVSVRNGDSFQLGNVIGGNEKVLVARLEDAQFFWREDQKLKIEDLVAKLSQVTFHEKIGSLKEHMDRTQVLAACLVDLLSLSEREAQAIARAAGIYKFDLLTGMVGEFDELQGILGEKYALLAGEDQAVATAIREHYLPNVADGPLPQTTVGTVLALADKLDTLLSFFSVGLIPSGSNDPYALRRATAGIVRILDAFNWHIDLKELVHKLYDLPQETLNYEHKKEVLDFIEARVDKLFAPSVPKDIAQACLARKDFIVSAILATGQALTLRRQEADFKPAVENLARVFNLADKAPTVAQADPGLFENESEQALYHALEGLVLTGDIGRDLDSLFALQPLISAFFDGTMVMVDDEKLKQNRLALLQQLADKAAHIARFNLINTK